MRCQNLIWYPARFCRHGPSSPFSWRTGIEGRYPCEDLPFLDIWKWRVDGLRWTRQGTHAFSSILMQQPAVTGCNLPYCIYSTGTSAQVRPHPKMKQALSAPLFRTPENTLEGRPSTIPFLSGLEMPGRAHFSWDFGRPPDGGRCLLGTLGRHILKKSIFYSFYSFLIVLY